MLVLQETAPMRHMITAITIKDPAWLSHIQIHNGRYSVRPGQGSNWRNLQKLLDRSFHMHAQHKSPQSLIYCFYQHLAFQMTTKSILFSW